MSEVREDPESSGASRRPWRPEVVVDLDLARRLIARHVPAWAGLPVAPFGSGWDNTAYLVDGRIVVRFPRRTISARLLELEARVLRRLAGRMPLPVPQPRWVVAPDEDFPWTWSAYALLPGRPLVDAALDGEACAALARPLAAFLRTLHALAPIGTVLPGDELRRLDLGHRVPRCLSALDDLERRGLIGSAAAFHPIVEALPARWTPRPRALVHGDLHARHVLVDPEARPCGVIDWGDVHHGDPAVDLAAAHALLPRSAHAAFLSEYGPVDDASWAVARFRALQVSAVVLAYASDVGDEAFGDAACAALTRLVAES